MSHSAPKTQPIWLISYSFGQTQHWTAWQIHQLNYVTMIYLMQQGGSQHFISWSIHIQIEKFNLQFGNLHNGQHFNTSSGLVYIKLNPNSKYKSGSKTEHTYINISIILNIKWHPNYIKWILNSILILNINFQNILT
jgi:hypothetical protein